VQSAARLKAVFSFPVKVLLLCRTIRRGLTLLGYAVGEEWEGEKRRRELYGIGILWGIDSHGGMVDRY
jgi:hypothetical protein